MWSLHQSAMHFAEVRKEKPKGTFHDQLAWDRADSGLPVTVTMISPPVLLKGWCSHLQAFELNTKQNEKSLRLSPDCSAEVDTCCRHRWSVLRPISCCRATGESVQLVKDQCTAMQPKGLSRPWYVCGYTSLLLANVCCRNWMYRLSFFSSYVEWGV